MNITPVNLSNITDLTALIRFLSPFCTQVGQAMNNQVTFQDNIRASTVSVSFPSAANQNIQIKHGLPVTPIGYIAIRLSGAASVYDGVSVVLGATFANLKCSSAGINATIMFF